MKRGVGDSLSGLTPETGEAALRVSEVLPEQKSAICLSEQAYWQVKGRLDLKVTDLGATQLKNIAEPIRVYAFDVRQPVQGKAASPPPEPEKSGPPRLSIVVLPFANVGGGTEQEYFVDGITESLTTDLSRIAGAFVIARNTACTRANLLTFRRSVAS
jgi:hypothetical protein